MPYGKHVAFVWNGGGDGFFHLYVKLVGGGEPLKGERPAAGMVTGCGRFGEKVEISRCKPSLLSQQFHKPRTIQWMTILATSLRLG